ncbi:uncharacterized protein B0H18DRAFT_1113337 [Fomitopsis serialis]|uniref:uncharacterized protein n=1 Tax=Fomitopsis serialis TaxID=139415 RepID=UPI0020080435|nr:uncharacterized protein B0H18DRAFT_1113337 [Neoantrodia serialis]KAH9937513.1 hypothetical protein B0H18DRAFT_1113337 [Neoantrodia serialis]
MRSPLIAFSLVAAAVSPSLAASHPNSPKFGRSVTHPRVTEVQSPGGESLQFKRSGMNGLGLDKLTGSGANPVNKLTGSAANPIDMVLPQGAAAAPAPKPGASKADAGNTDPFDLPFDPTNNPPTIPDPETVAPGALGNVPVSPAEPAQPGNPYGSGQGNGNAAPDGDNNGTPGRHTPNREEIEQMFGSGGAW